MAPGLGDRTAASDFIENYRYDVNNTPPSGGKAKYNANITAINTLLAIESENRSASPGEQALLAQYGGWGNLPQAFEPNREDWTKEYAELRGLLTGEEYAAARKTTLNAHYTSPEVVSEIWRAVKAFGFGGGTVLEPSMGTGNFFASMTDDIFKESRLYGVELDRITGRIAEKLYPSANIQVCGFEDTSFENNTFDLAISNVPFGAYKVADRDYDGFFIHDYFIQKSLDKIRPGGIAAMITTSGTMDKHNPEARRWFAQRAELTGAIRLTNQTFKQSAGTQVTADILFFKKRETLDVYAEPSWLYVDKTVDGVPINRYFLENPDMMCGKMVFDNAMYGSEKLTACHVIDGEPWEERLRHAIDMLPKGIFEQGANTRTGDTDDWLPADPAVKNHTFTLIGDTFYYRENSTMKPCRNIKGATYNRFLGLHEIRNTVRSIIDAQLNDESDERVAELQAELEMRHTSFTAKFGAVGSKTNMSHFRLDADWPLLKSLEDLDKQENIVRKADIFSKRTIQPVTVITKVETPQEALTVSLNQRGRVDLEYMSGLCGKEEEVLLDELKGLVFLDPKSGAYQTADEYLSGNVREKLSLAVFKAEEDTRYQENVEALTSVQPIDLEAGDIAVRIGASWIDIEDYERFMYSLLQTPTWLRRNGGSFYTTEREIRISYHQHTNEWSIANKSKHKHSRLIDELYGTKRIGAYEIMEETLNQRTAIVRDRKEGPDGKKFYVTNAKETEIAKDRQRLLNEKFREWLFMDDSRREKYVRRYNDTFNAIRLRVFDGEGQVFPGINTDIDFMPHQLSAIQRGKFGGNTLLAHAVGAGKTFEMTAIIMSKVQLGLSHKACFVVPKHLTGQTAAEFLRLYPSARLLVADPKDFQKNNRRAFMSRVATGSFDAVIMGYTQLERVPVSEEAKLRHLYDELALIDDNIDAVENEDGNRLSVKKLEQTKVRIEAEIKKLLNTPDKDDVVYFEELGFDMLVVDEAHYYKNCAVHTKLRNVAGISDTRSQKSIDMMLKCKFINEKTNYTGLVFATGTPVSNSMTEMFTMTRYLRPDILAAQDMEHFDNWAANYGEVVSQLELAPSGKGFKMRDRFAKFNNLPELLTAFRTFADVQTPEQLNLPVPSLVSGKPIIVTSEADEYQKTKTNEFVTRAAEIHAGRVKPWEDNMLKVTGEARLIALDPRTLNPSIPENPSGKIAQCAENIYEIYRDSADNLGVQIVFCDISTPNRKGFSAYKALRDKLTGFGIPEEEIAFIHDADTSRKKDDLFEQCRNGEVRVIMGSTAKMGTGTNIQNRLIALHHLDVPWRPADIEQREGRIIRQHNMYNEVYVYRYATKGTFDAYMWSIVENKQKFVAQVMTDKVITRSCENVDAAALSYAEIKAIATGNPLIREKMEVDTEVSRLQTLKSDYTNRRFRLQSDISTKLPRQLEQIQERSSLISGDIALRDQTKDADFTITIMDRRFDASMEHSKEQAGEALMKAVQLTKVGEVIGEYRGFKLIRSAKAGQQNILTSEARLVLQGSYSYDCDMGDSALGNITRLENTLKNLDALNENNAAHSDKLRQELESAKLGLDEPFEHEERLQSLLTRQVELNAALDLDRPDEVFADDNREMAAADTDYLDVDEEEPYEEDELA